MEIATAFHRALTKGDVRAPLLDPTPEHVARLTTLIDRGLEAIRA
jgi:5-dehydro-4-deoxyglucarate dehydratase